MVEMKSSRVAFALACAGLMGALVMTGCKTGDRSSPKQTTGTGVTTEEKRTQTFKDTRSPQGERERPLANILPDSPMREPAPAATPPPPPAPRGGCIPAGFNRAQTAFPTGDVRTSAILVEKGVPPQVVKGEEFDFIICVTNLTSMELTNIEITDELSSGWKLQSSTPSWFEDIPGTPYDVYMWRIDTLAPGETTKIDIKAVADNTSERINACAYVRWESGVCVATRVVEPALRVAKTATPEVLQCDPITITYTVTNPGTGVANDVVITDRLPNGLQIDGSSNVRIPVGTLGAGQSREVVKQAVASRTGRLGSAAGANASGGLSADSAEASTMVRKPALELEQSCPELRFFGREAKVELTVRNSGNGVARNATLEASMPSAARFLSASDNGRVAGGKVVWSLGDMAPNASKRVEMNFTADTEGMMRVTSMAQAFCADAVQDNCAVRFEGIPAILVECIDLEDPDEVGTTETYVITVTNQGTANDTNIRVKCTIPPEMSYDSSTGATRANVRGQVVTFEPLPSLAPKAQAVWRVTVMANEPGDVRFAIEVTSDQFNDPPIIETESTNLYR
jgi:uncharacterized repeat protein (TIGR01451 family)